MQSQSMLANQKTGFDPRLESLRGIAALAVVMAHASAVLRIDGSPAYWATPLAEQTLAQQLITLGTALFNPTAAVVLFFVLSGYVLTLSLTRQSLHSGNVPSYIARRLFRLLPPMWASIGLMLVVLWLAPPAAGSDVFSNWYAAVFVPGLSPSDVLSNLVLLGFRVNAVTWTMYVELIGSVFLLVSLALGSRGGRYADMALLAGLAALTLVTYPSPTLSYLLCFQVGIAVAKGGDNAIPVRGAVLCSLAIAVFAFERLAYSSQPGGILLLSAASAALLAGVRRGAFHAFLMSAPLRFLGKVSYSLYLLHPPVLYLTGRAAAHLGVPGPGIAPPLFVFAVSIPASILLAWGGYALVERWSIGVGRKLSNRIVLWAGTGAVAKR